MGLRTQCTAGVLILVAIALPFSSARSEFIRVYAGVIQAGCISDDLLMRSWCEGYISSELEVIANSPIKGITACIPHQVTLQEGVAIVKQWFANHPDEPPQQPAFLAVARALAEAYPCKKKETPLEEPSAR
jgi:hypothetical protein